MLSLRLAVGYFAAAIIIASFAAPSIYKWQTNTISDLAAQDHIYKWIMQAGFVGFGLISSYACLQVVWNLWPSVSLMTLAAIAIFAYSMCILLSGFFCAAALTTNAYDYREASLHSLFAQIAGVFFTVAIVLHIINAGTTRLRILHCTILVLVIICLAGFALFPASRGIWQRMLYFISFLWLWFCAFA